MLRRRVTAFAALAVCLALTLLMQGAEAARVTPMVVEIRPSGANSVVRIEVTNDEDREVPFEISMHRGVISETGEVTLEPADDKFVVFPPQVVLAPRSQQVFRVQFLPDPDLKTSEIYYASVSQVPVALDPAESQIQLLMRFNVLINVVPPGTNPEPVVDWVRPAERAQLAPEQEEANAEVPPEKGIEVRISNRGDRYFGAGEASWTISGIDPSGAAFEEALSARQVRNSTGLGIVAPGRSRIFFIPLDRPVNPDSLQIKFS